MFLQFSDLEKRLLLGCINSGSAVCLFSVGWSLDEASECGQR